MKQLWLSAKLSPLNQGAFGCSKLPVPKQGDPAAQMVAGLGLPLHGCSCRDVQLSQGSSCDFSCTLHGMKPNSSGVRNPPGRPYSALNFFCNVSQREGERARRGCASWLASADAQPFIHGWAPFSSCFSPSTSFLRANGAAGGLSLGGWGEPTPQWVAVINGGGVRKQPARYPGNPAVFPALQGCVWG